MMSARVCFLLFVSALTMAQSNPVPFINQPLVPSSVAPGSGQLTLTVNGTGFVSGSVVKWNGATLATTFVNSAQLKATVPSANVAVVGTASITVSSAGVIPSNEVFFQVMLPAPTVWWSPPQVRNAGRPVAVITGDFNADGKLDIALLNNPAPSTGTVSILLGNGDGTFSSPVNYAVGYDPAALVAGDFNGDGKLDLVVTHQDCPSGSKCAGKISVLVGNGDGTFQAYVDYPTDVSPSAIVAADFNGDGKLDVAAVTAAGFDILLGNGDGSFQTPISSNPGLNMTGVSVGDFNSDGKLDLAVTNYCSPTNCGSPAIDLLLGNGDGTFQSPSAVSVPDAPLAIAAGDFNKDGILDIVVIGCPDSNCAEEGSVNILLGEGGGKFSLGSYSAVVNHQPSNAVVGDFNGDGNLDFALGGNGKFSVFFGNGDGTFRNLDFGGGGGVFNLATGDFNGDGRLDFATSAQIATEVAVALQLVPSITLSATNLTFPTQVVYTTSPAQVVTLKNAGLGPAVIKSVTLTGAFGLTKTCGTGVLPGGGCAFSVAFKPKSIGALTGSLTVTDDTANSPHTVTLTGTGTYVRVTPTSINFGNQPEGTKSLPTQITMNNQGSVAVAISGVAITGAHAADFTQTNTCGTSLAAGGSCFINVTFAPSGTGNPTAQVVISDNGGGSPQMVSLVGTGIP